ncbi:MAG: hypothetical protein R3287_03945 [Anderseniella sp.]|nr:hypothetical protein [Anderseniella sp.]
MKKCVLAAAITLPFVSGCASKSSDIQAAYVSPIQYQQYSCDQLLAEGQRLSARAAVVSGQQDDKRTSDAVMTGVAVVVFWPALFALEGDGQTAAELARLKGELEAVEKASIQKNCGIQFRRS